MLQGSTRCSGITAGHHITHRLLTVGLPFFAPLRDQCLRCLIEGALEAASPCVPSPGRAASLLALSSLRSRTFGCALFALAVRFVISLRFHARSCPPSAPGEGGIPNTATPPSGLTSTSPTRTPMRRLPARKTTAWSPTTRAWSPTWPATCGRTARCWPTWWRARRAACNTSGINHL